MPLQSVQTAYSSNVFILWQVASKGQTYTREVQNTLFHSLLWFTNKNADDSFTMYIYKMNIYIASQWLFHHTTVQNKF